jgi:hypothetical protein
MTLIFTTLASYYGGMRRSAEEVREIRHDCGKFRRCRGEAVVARAEVSLIAAIGPETLLVDSL